jgi:hypothetical protein
MTRRVLLASAVVALVACPAAAGHGDGAARGYRSKVTEISPAVTGLAVTVGDGDDRLRLRNDTGRGVVVEGYDGEPYLRFAAGGEVFRNESSPARYLNEERYGGVDVPATASKNAPPRWSSIADGGTYEWHDHRIHWMSTIDPPRVRRAPQQRQHVFAWTIPGTIDGRPLEIRGSLDYEPPPESRFRRLLLLPLVALVLAGGGFWLLRRRRSP